MFKSRIVKREDGGTECHCAICDTTLTWFTFENVWYRGKIIGRVCNACYLSAIYAGVKFIY